jgi:hypothetical protein
MSNLLRISVSALKGKATCVLIEVMESNRVTPLVSVRPRGQEPCYSMSTRLVSATTDRQRWKIQGIRDRAHSANKLRHRTGKRGEVRYDAVDRPL